VGFTVELISWSIYFLGMQINLCNIVKSELECHGCWSSSQDQSNRKSQRNSKARMRKSAMEKIDWDQLAEMAHNAHNATVVNRMVAAHPCNVFVVLRRVRNGLTIIIIIIMCLLLTERHCCFWLVWMHFVQLHLCELNTYSVWCVSRIYCVNQHIFIDQNSKYAVYNCYSL